MGEGKGGGGSLNSYLFCRCAAKLDVAALDALPLAHVPIASDEGDRSFDMFRLSLVRLDLCRVDNFTERFHCPVLLLLIHPLRGTLWLQCLSTKRFPRRGEKEKERERERLVWM